MKASVVICVISLCCWGLGIIFYTQMLRWREPAILAAGFFMLIGATTLVMGIACAMVDFTRGMDSE